MILIRKLVAFRLKVYCTLHAYDAWKRLNAVRYELKYFLKLCKLMVSRF